MLVKLVQLKDDRLAGLLRQILGQRDREPAVIPGVAGDERIYAIGDVHGRVDLLLRLIERIVEDIEQHADGRTPRLIFLGDYIDRGDQSADVIAALMRMEDELAFDGIDFLMGNHEAALLDFLADPERGKIWFRFGGLQTLASYGVAPPRSNTDLDELRSVSDALRDSMGAHLEFLQSTRKWLRSGDVVFAHAGLAPDTPLDAQTDDALLWGRSSFLAGEGVPGLRVVHGHWDDPMPVLRPYRICVDTGAYYSGILTAVRLDAGDHLIQVNALDPIKIDLR